MTNSAALTFDDEFNSLSLWNGTSGTWDTTAQYATWNGSGFSLPSNGEQEWYINSNYAPTASVQPWTVNNGVMTIAAAPASSEISSLIGGYQYTSGSVNTSESFSQTYGYFEMRAQLPAGQGLWPAFWLLPENGSWPPEIDAMEMLGNDPSVYYTSIHSGTAANEVNAGQADTVANTSTGYHTFGVDWEPDYITYYFDGQQVYKVATPSDMNSPMYMIANLAVGGAWPGNADGTTHFPAQMNVDWIRAYSSLPSWIADGSDGTDVGHTPAGATGSTGGTGTGGTGGTDPGTAANPAIDTQPTYTVASGITDVLLTGTSAQTITANGLGDTITSNDFGSTLIGGAGNDTFIAGHGADTMTGGAGSDTFTFNMLPWNAGHITDFTPGVDKLDLAGIFQSVGYTGANPVADGYLSFAADGAGNTSVLFHTPGQSWPTLITTLNGVSPSSITAADYGFGTSSGSGGTGSGSTTGSTAVDTAAATYTAPSDVTNIVLTGTSAQTVTANNLGDTITSNDYGSTLVGGTGNDTLIAGHGADHLTGGAGSDTFVFDAAPWNAGHVTDFNVSVDKLDLSGIFSAIGYTGTDAVADGYLSFTSDGAGNTQVLVNSHSASNPWPTLITTLDHVAASSITPADYAVNASDSGTGATPSTPSAPPVSTSAATYTAAAGVTDVTLTGTSAQTVTANNLGDTIHSNDAGSTIIGGSGNDTFVAGHGADMLTGGAGGDTFVFNNAPWSAGHITDFNTAQDVLNLKGIFATIGYSGTNPVADGYLSFASDGAGDTKVYVNAHNPANPWPTLVTTLDHVSPSDIASHDYIFH